MLLASAGNPDPFRVCWVPTDENMKKPSIFSICEVEGILPTAGKRGFGHDDWCPWFTLDSTCPQGLCNITRSASWEHVAVQTSCPNMGGGFVLKCTEHDQFWIHDDPWPMGNQFSEPHSKEQERFFWASPESTWTSRSRRAPLPGPTLRHFKLRNGTSLPRFYMFLFHSINFSWNMKIYQNNPPKMNGTSCHITETL